MFGSYSRFLRTGDLLACCNQCAEVASVSFFTGIRVLCYVILYYIIIFYMMGACIYISVWFVVQQ